MTDLRTAAKEALRAFQCHVESTWPTDRSTAAIAALRAALAQEQEQEPVAIFDWLPEGATHLGRISVRACAGGSLAMSTHAFKYDNGVLKVYVTDNDNEYPGWRDAKDIFFHLNFPVLPLYTALRAALAQQDEPVQEPVAWLYEAGADRTLHWHKPPLYGTPLYTAPPQRQPQTIDEAMQQPRSMAQAYEAGYKAGVAHEREACAQVCEARFVGDLTREDMEARRCAAAIRARGEQP